MGNTFQVKPSFFLFSLNGSPDLANIDVTPTLRPHGRSQLSKLLGADNLLPDRVHAIQLLKATIRELLPRIKITNSSAISPQRVQQSVPKTFLESVAMELLSGPSAGGTAHGRLFVGGSV